VNLSSANYPECAPRLALGRNNYNRTRTAKELGVSRVTLYNKMKRYNLS
ncbi:MAG: AAA family ATPase, partial [Planctomycetota bacterium]|nr:AAA family ATPase [Planctomycetota bacterium]